MGQEEGFNRGLWTAADAAFVPPGALQQAANTRYRPGDPALWQAEGRERLAGGGDITLIDQVVGLAFDPPELPIILYERFADGPESRVGTATQADSFRINGSVNELSSHGKRNPGDLALDSVNVDGPAVIVNGGTPDYVTLAGTTLTRRRLGMPAFNGTLTGNVVTGGAVGSFTTTGGREVWVCYAVRENGVWYRGPALSAMFHVGALPTLLQYVSVTCTWPRAGTANSPFTSAQDLYLEFYANPTLTTPIMNPSGSLRVGSAPAFPTGVLLGRLHINRSSGAITDDLYNLSATATTGSITFADPFQAVSPDWRPLFEFETGTTLWPDLSRSFDIVQIRVGSRAVPQELYKPPPTRCSTATWFQGSAVLNDLDNPRKLVFNYPGDLEAWPTLFFIVINSDQQDEITCLRAFGKVLMVWTKSALWRVNWLPTEQDVSFERSSIYDIVSRGFGAPRPQAVTEFQSIDGPMLSWVNADGWFVGDSHSGRPATSHVDWKSMGVDASKAFLVNNVTEWRLELWSNDKAWYLHYHPTHVVDGIFSITGPIIRPGGVVVATPVQLEDGSRKILTTDKHNGLCYEGAGFIDEAEPTVPLLMVAETREVYPAGKGQQGVLEGVWLHMKPTGFTNANYAAIVYPLPAAPGKTFPLTYGDRELRSLDVEAGCESFKLFLAGVGLPMALNSFTYDWRGQGGAKR